MKKTKKYLFANSKNGGGILDTKNAFTLIELLTIIVILAIIAVITVPIILNIIENSKKGAATDSAYGYKDAVNKWYVQELSKPENQNLLLNGTYTITDGNLGNNQIPVTGDKPVSGTLTYSNNTLTNGCLTIGDYKVTFTNGEVSSTVKGECEVSQETVLYFTYDATAPADANGYRNSAKLPQPDASWKIYIKETLGADSYYAIEFTQNNELQHQLHFNTLNECEEVLNSVPQEQVQAMQASCKNVIASLYEVFGIENFGTEDAVTFSVKPRDYENSTDTLITALSNCGLDNNAFECLGPSIYAIAYSNTDDQFANGVTVALLNNFACYVSGLYDEAGCRALES